MKNVAASVIRNDARVNNGFVQKRMEAQCKCSECSECSEGNIHVKRQRQQVLFNKETDWIEMLTRVFPPKLVAQLHLPRLFQQKVGLLGSLALRLRHGDTLACLPSYSPFLYLSVNRLFHPAHQPPRP